MLGEICLIDCLLLCQMNLPAFTNKVYAFLLTNAVTLFRVFIIALQVYSEVFIPQYFRVLSSTEIVEVSLQLHEQKSRWLI